MEQSSSPAPSPRLPILLLFVGAGVAAALAELRWLPYLATTQLYYVLTLATTIVVASSLGLTFSGFRRRLARPLRLATTLTVSALSAATVFVLVVLPYLNASPPRHDAPVTFATAVPVVATGIPAVVAVPPAASAVRGGAFNHTPGFDTVSGTAALGKTADGLSVLRLSGLDSTPGPDLYVYLDRIESPAGAQAASGLEVAALKTYRGDFTFPLEAGLDLSQFKSVAIYCRSYNIVFGYANLA